MKLPGWLVTSLFVAFAFSGVALVKVVARFPRVSLPDSFAALGVTFVGGGVAGLSHHFARRWIARRPLGIYVYGILFVETYLFTIMGCLTIVKALDLGVLVKPGRQDLFAEWRAWPWFAALGVLCGLVWGFLSRNDEQP